MAQGLLVLNEWRAERNMEATMEMGFRAECNGLTRGHRESACRYHN